MTVCHYSASPEVAPIDFFADPDGDWTYEALLEAAGFHPESADGVLIGALETPWRGHPDGSAVVCGHTAEGPRLCVVECGLATSTAA